MNLIPPKISTEIKHTHLTNYFKTHPANSRHFMATMQKFPDLNRNIGNIPPFWAKKLPKNQIGETNKALQKLFSNFAKKVYSPQERNNFTKRCKQLSESLKTLIHRNIKVTPYKQGKNGRTFIIDVDNEQYVLKTFHSDPDFSYYSPHGKGFEVFSGLFASRNGTKKAAAKFYMGKIAREKDKDGYLLTKMVDEKNSKKHTNFIMSYLNRFIDYEDCIGGFNKVNDTCFDFGAITIDKSSSHPKVRKIIRSFIHPITLNDTEGAKQAVELHKNSPYWKQALAAMNEKIDSYGIVFEPILSKELKEAIGIKITTQEDFKLEIQNILNNIRIE